ncbi:magnesium-dependent phosphatase 1 isoform X3 [Halyomorpha halys]|uniref:magnesium-dependent phosphatase 1 isoform X3 n=1 Tax=Halyomorpha halys TaxID=286706 RepID=UPI0034D345CF
MTSKILPKLVVFDLDLTLWDVQVDKCNPPFHKKDESITDEKSKIVKLYPDVLNVLNSLKKYGFPLSIASRITDISGAYQLLNLFNLNGYFDHLEIYPTEKTLHFCRPSMAMGVEVSL